MRTLILLDGRHTAFLEEGVLVGNNGVRNAGTVGSTAAIVAIERFNR